MLFIREMDDPSYIENPMWILETAVQNPTSPASINSVACVFSMNRFFLVYFRLVIPIPLIVLPIVSVFLQLFPRLHYQRSKSRKPRFNMGHHGHHHQHHHHHHRSAPETRNGQRADRLKALAKLSVKPLSKVVVSLARNDIPEGPRQSVFQKELQSYSTHAPHGKSQLEYHRQSLHHPSSHGHSHRHHSRSTRRYSDHHHYRHREDHYQHSRPPQSLHFHWNQIQTDQIFYDSPSVQSESLQSDSSQPLSHHHCTHLDYSYPSTNPL